MRTLGATGVGHLVMSGHFRECERMRASISAALDGELSEPESIRVGDHVEHCAWCRGFQADTKGFVSTLRTAPLEPLGRPLAVHPRCELGRVETIEVRRDERDPHARLRRSTIS